MRETEVGINPEGTRLISLQLHYEAKTMQLTYRGIKYDYNPPTVDTIESAAGGKYRGWDWRFRNLKNPPVLQPRVNLKYRGVRYQTPGTVWNNGVPVENVPTLVSSQEKARSRMSKRQQVLKNRQLSMLYRSATEIGLAAH